MAASKVNTKFVVILVAGLVALVGGGAALAYFFLLNNSTRLAANGRAALERGDYVTADRFLSKAVNKEQTNAGYIRDWLKAMESLVPETETAYRSKYSGDYYRAKIALARALKTDIEAHVSALAPIHIELRDTPNDSNGNSTVAEMVTSSLSYFEGSSDKKHQVLRKYRGLALLRSYDSGVNMKEQEIQLAKDDLEAALVADPTDEESATGLSLWWEQTALSQSQKQDFEASKASKDKSRQVIAEFIAAHPGCVEPRIVDVLYTLADRTVEIRALPVESDREQGAKDMIALLETKIKGVAEAMDKVDPAKLDVVMVERLQRSESDILGSGNGLKLAEAQFRKMLAVRKDDARTMVALAALLAARGDNQEAIDQLQVVMDLPPAPLSFRGNQQFGMKSLASYLQAQSAIRLWETTTDAAAKKQWMDKAVAYRTKLAEAVNAENSQLLYIDAQLCFAREDFGQAQKRLLEYCRRNDNRDVQALWLLAESSNRIGQPGVAYEKYQLILQREPFHVRALTRLGQLTGGPLKKLDESLLYFERVLKVDPNNEIAKPMVIAIKGRMSETGPTGDDPVLNGLSAVEKLEFEGKVNEAFAVLSDLAAKYPESRVVMPLAVRMSQRSDKAGALKLVEACLVREPQNDRLKMLKIALTHDDPYERDIAIVDQADKGELDKLIAKCQLSIQYDKLPQAAEFLKRAVALDPANAAVIEFQFMLALTNKDFKLAEKMTEEARTRDLDLLEGATFRSRLLDAQGRTADAVRELEGVRNKATFGVESARLLAGMMVKVGRPADAIGVLRDALTKRMTDRECLMSLAQLLVQLDRGREAREEVRSRIEFHRADQRVMNIWLELESRFGSQENRELALKERRKQLEINPNDRTVQMSLARLFVEMKRWPEGRLLIDQIRKDKVDLEIVEIDARWSADRTDIPTAKKVYDDYIASLKPEDINSEILLGKGAFMERIEQFDAAVEAYKQAANYQDPKKLQADKALADLYTRRGRLLDAADLFRKLVETGADEPDHAYAKRLLDVYLRSNRLADATKILDSLGAAVNDDAVLTLQKTELVKLGGDEKGAAKMLDAAVTRFPNDPQVYYRRALANSQYSELKGDVLKDLKKAIDLRPGFWQARRDRARLYSRDGMIDEAVTDMREAVKLNPGIDELRVTLIRELLQAKRDGDALEVAEDVITKRTGDLSLLVNTGDLFREFGNMDRALDYYKRAHDISNQLFVVLRYLDLLQGMRPPNLKVADEVLLKVGSKVVEEEPSLLMATAKQFAFRKKYDEAMSTMMAAIRKVPEGRGDLVMFWYQDVKRTLGSNDDVMRVIDAVERDPKLIPGWTTFFRAGTALEKPATQKEGIAQLEELINKSPADKQLLRQAMLMLQAKYYQLKDCDNALRVMSASEQAFPEDSGILNNLAFMMVTCGKPPKDAVPFAERAKIKAFERGQDLLDVLDTLGWVYTRAGMLKEAEGPLLDALSLAGSSTVKPTVMLHFAELLTAQGKFDEAQKVIDEAREFFDKLPKEQQIQATSDLFDEEKALLAKARSEKK
ncbi:MAG: tetratricopeptide repeat protein [Planctomycetota bacterium]